jgi:hypothetical protein
MAVFSTIGSVIASGSQNKANKRAAATSERTFQQSLDFAREGRNEGYRRLDTFGNRGNLAGDQINALLGLGGSQVQGGPAQVTPNALSQFQGGPAGGAGAPYGVSETPGYGFAGPSQSFNALRPQLGLATPNPAAGGQFQGGPQAQGLTAQQAANNAFDIFRNSTGYQFRLGEGQDAVTSAYAGIGGLQSGAALRGIQEYGQNFASNEFGNYLNALGNQQAVGAGAASSAAGVSQNFANSAINANNNNAQNQIAAQLGRQNPFANALGTYGGAIQSTIGAIAGGGFG